MQSRYLAVRSLAQAEHLALAAIIEACEHGQLDARQIGREWYVSDQDLNRCRESGSVNWSEPQTPFKHHRVLTGLFLMVTILAVVEAVWTTSSWRYLANGSRLSASLAQSHWQTLRTSHWQNNLAAPFSEVNASLNQLWQKVNNWWQIL